MVWIQLRRVYVSMPAECGGKPIAAVAIIDRQTVVHAGIQHWFAEGPQRMEVVGNFADPADFLSAHPAPETVDVVLYALDHRGQRPDFDTLREICRAGHHVIVYSYLVTDEVVLTSLDAGALTYVDKSENREYLREAVSAAQSSTPYVAPRMARALLSDKVMGRPHLSNREREVLVAWFQTENKDLVGRHLYIEPSTVRTHLQRVRAKYAAVGRPAHTKAALIARAIQDGILSVDDL